LSLHIPVTQRELWGNLGANVAGGTVTGTIAGACPGCGIAGSAFIGGAGAGGGGILKWAIDPETMETDALDRDAIIADVAGGALGGAGGKVASDVTNLVQSGAVEKANVGAWAARAAADTDRTVVATAIAMEKQAASLARQTAENAVAAGAVSGEIIADVVVAADLTEDSEGNGDED